MIFIFSTFPNKQIAVKIGKKLLKLKQIACYNFWPVESAYWWFTPPKSKHESSTNSSEKTSAEIRLGKRKIISDNEFLMILKTKEENFEIIKKLIKENHPYEVPEIVSVKTYKVNLPYLNWIDKEVK